MADPLIVGGIRAQVVIEGISGMPEDRYITTWAFAKQPPGAVDQTALDDTAAALTEFFTGEVGLGDTVRSWFGSQCSDVATINLYDLGQTPPREPNPYELEWTITSQASYPSEVASCLSFYSDRNLPRQRGRVFLGPLRTTVGESPDGIPRPKELFRTDVAEAASTLAGLTSSVRWGVLSQADEVILEVTNGWIDDAFDIQRRRGEDPTLRTTWP